MANDGHGHGAVPGPDIATTLSRRGLLSAGTAGALAVAVTACSDEASTPESSPPPGEGAESPGADLTLATTALGMELLAVATYESAVAAMDEGRVGEVPPAVRELVTTVRAHHLAHRDAWGELVGSSEAPEPNAVLVPMERRFAQQAAELVDAAGLARLVRDVEEIVSDTYFLVLPSITAEAVLALAATMQPVDSQHAAIARFLLGEYPVPATFATGDLAFGRGGG